MFGQRLKYLREHMELSQTEVAEKLEILQNSYSRYERGERMPDWATIQRIARFYDVSIDYLVGNDAWNPDLVDLYNFLLHGNYTIEGRFPEPEEREMLHDIVKAIYMRRKKA